VQLVHDPQLAQETSAGQLLVLHSLSAFMTPEQPTPPGHVLSLLDFPPPQILLQLLQDPQFDHLTSAGQVLLLQSLVSVPSPVQPDPPLHERCLSDLPPPQLLLQLLQDPQLDQVTVTEQVLLLHSRSSTLSPEQAVPPAHERCLLNRPPPQLLLQLVQGPQFDHLTSAGQEFLLQSLVSMLSPEQPRPAEHKRCLFDFPLPQLLVQLLQGPQIDHVSTEEEGSTIVGDVVVLEVAVIAESSFLMHVTPATSAMPQDLSAVWGQWRRWDSSPLHLRSLIANSVPTSTPPKCELVRATARLYPKILQITSASL